MPGTFKILTRHTIRGSQLIDPNTEVVHLTAEDVERNRTLTFDKKDGGTQELTVTRSEDKDRRWENSVRSSGFRSMLVTETYFDGIEYVMGFIGKSGDGSVDDDTDIEVFVATSGGGY